jgi:hypothetical protein
MFVSSSAAKNYGLHGMTNIKGGEHGMPRTLRARKPPMISLNPWYAIWTILGGGISFGAKEFIVLFVNRFYTA